MLYRMLYRMATLPMTLSDIKPPCANFYILHCLSYLWSR